jgi:hypothetical protein
MVMAVALEEQCCALVPDCHHTKAGKLHGDFHSNNPYQTEICPMQRLRYPRSDRSCMSCAGFPFVMGTPSGYTSEGHTQEL